MQRCVALTAALLVSLPAMAVTPRSWSTATAEEFLAGEISQIGLTATGSLVPAPGVVKLASIDDPFVLSQASGPGAQIFLGTGNNGRLYAVDRSGSLRELFRAPEPEIYAVVWHNGAVYAATSPWGGVYRIDPASGSSQQIWKSEQAYIWTMQVDGGGNLVVGTGLEGSIYRISRDGTASRLWTAPESHVRSLTVRSDGTLLAGGSGEGRIYRVDTAGNAQALFDSSLTEITSVTWSSAGSNGWAAASAGLLPAQAPQRTDTSRQQQQQSGAAGADAPASSEPQRTPSAEVSISFDSNTPTAAAPGATGTSELYRIHTDGYVETIRKFDREIIYALEPYQGGVLVGTGPQGRVYRVTEDSMTLLGSVAEKQIVSLQSAGDAVLVTTSNAGAVYRLGGESSQEGTWTSPVRDAAIFSRWGSWQLDGRNLDPRQLTVSFRSGNSATPDETWSSWNTAQGVSGATSAPPARYLQYRVGLASSAAAGARIDRVVVNYLQRNVRPVIESLAVHDPGVVFISASYPQSPQVVEATNPDEFGIFSSLEAPRDRTDPGKRMFRKGYRTIAWKARDENGDSLTYALEFRPMDGSEWMRLRENIQDAQLNFDSAQLPDGTYEVRLTASDRRENPDDPATTTRAGVFFDVDNAAPTITSSRRGSNIEVTVRDERSSIIRVDMAIGAKEWVRLQPEDGIADSPVERFLIAAPAGREHVMIRAVDAQFNVTTAAVGAP